MGRVNTVLVVGSGGREHALAWVLSRSPQVKQVYIAPGNGGTGWAENPDPQGLQPAAACQNVPISAEDFPALIQFAQQKEVALTVVGPEVPLALGVVDAFQAAGLKVFGPTQAAAQLEASKAFAKAVMVAQKIPTADYGVFEDFAAARDFLKTFAPPVAIKADGLAAGKGVLICHTTAEAEAALHTILKERKFGAAGEKVVIEALLEGEEFSLLAFCDGKTVRPMLAARDHKRIFDGDLGANTGGMGAFAPAQELNPAQIDQICRTVLQPTLDGMAERGTPYKGVLYAGLMQTRDGMRVLEFNCRFGDPETQVILPLLASDLYEVLLACVEERLDQISLEWKSESCATVALASGGYPENYLVGLPISGLESLPASVMAFHAGTAQQSGKLVTAGGRVLALTALGNDLERALAQIYASIDTIHFEGMHFRHDIGKRAETLAHG